MKRILLAALIALLSPAAYAQDWAFTLTPYVWLPSINGKLKYDIPPGAGGAPEVDTGPNNYLENLSAVLMLAGDARKGDWSIFTDLIYLKFDKEKSNVNSIDFGMNPAEAGAAVRTHHQWLPDELRIERGLSPDTVAILRGYGHKVVERPAMGDTQTIQILPTGFYGYADQRDPNGAARGY